MGDYRIGELVGRIYCIEVQADLFVSSGLALQTEDPDVFRNTFKCEWFDHNGMFGPYVWIAMNLSQDTPENWARIRRAFDPIALGVDRRCRRPGCGLENRADDTHCQACGQKL